MEYQIIRSKRRSVALVVDRQGNLIVRAPRYISQSEIAAFVAQKLRWIEKHQTAAAERNAKQKQYIEGEQFLFLGQEYLLRMVDGQQRRLNFDRQAFLLPKSQLGRAKQQFADWYRQQAQYLLPKRAEFWRQKMGVAFARLTVTGAGSRWGSCSSRGTINFSWRLMTAPLAVVDYVVIHELAHLAHHNHSHKFWRLVRQFCPEYQTSKKWLNESGKNPVL